MLSCNAENWLYITTVFCNVVVHANTALRLALTVVLIHILLAALLPLFFPLQMFCLLPPLECCKIVS